MDFQVTSVPQAFLECVTKMWIVFTIKGLWTVGV